ncbi:MAG: hypothetical protein ACRD08_19200, partial [Acidimicrobiales bacterium]
MTIPPIPTPMPLLMRVGAVLATVFVVLAAALFVRAVLGIGPHRIGGRPVTPEEWLRLAGPLLVAAAGFMGAIAYGFRTRKPWARHMVMAHWAVVGFYGLGLGAAGQLSRGLTIRVVVQAVAFGAAAWWYFYRKPN